MKHKQLLSVIIPVLNEQEVLAATLKEITLICVSLDCDYEIILVDDGSTDRTPFLIEVATRENDRIKAITLSKNFGHQAAFCAGIDFASGDMVLTMDGDLQHPPSFILEFVRAIREGNDIVIGERMKNKQNSFLREFTGKAFYKILSLITDLEFRNASDFAMYNTAVITALRHLPERERYLRGLVQWVGFQKKYIPYRVEERKAGMSKYTVWKLLKLIISGVTSFSAFPLRLALGVGVLIFISGIVFSAYVAVDHYVNPNSLIAGWATTVILILLMGGIQLTVLGIIGEYLYKIFNEIKGRPFYIISKLRNMRSTSVLPTPYGMNVFRNHDNSR